MWPSSIGVGGDPFTTLHLNEGHCAFAPLELERQGWSRSRIARSTLFTTHTPVPAGHDRFGWDDVERTLGPLMPKDVREALHPEHLSMSHLAAHYAGRMNGVSVLNAEVAHTMFEGRSVEGITERWSEWGPELRSRATVRRAHWGQTQDSSVPPSPPIRRSRDASDVGPQPPQGRR